MAKELKNKPLKEAIFELRWDLGENTLFSSTTGYKFLIGKIEERFKREYPVTEQLQTATIPEDIIKNIVQYRFRKEINGWPLIQVGPGVVTINDTEKYNWDLFESHASDLTDKFFELYSDKEKIEKFDLILRYINSIKVDFSNKSIFDFLKENMNISMSFTKNIFNSEDINENPLDFDLNMTFPNKKEGTTIYLKLRKLKEKEEFLWELLAVTSGEKFTSEEIKKWLAEAHKILEELFFNITGDKILKESE